MAITAKPTAYTVNAGHAYAPTHLWMCDEGTGTTIADQGTGTAHNMTLQNADMWGTDGSLGSMITAVASTSRYALGASGTLFTGSVCMVVLAKSTTNSNADANEYVIGCADTGAVGDRLGALAVNGAQTSYVTATDAAANSVSVINAGTFYNSGWHMLAVKFRNGTSISCCAISLDGGAWTNDGTASINALSALDRYGLGCRPASSPSQFFDGSILAAWVYEDPTYTALDDSWISTLYSDPWQFLTTGTKYLKLLAHNSAASATGVDVVVYSAPTGSDYVSGTTRYGSATNQSFEASLESGDAVLKVLASDVGCGSLAVDTSVRALAQNTTYTTGMVTATIIEE